MTGMVQAKPFRIAKREVWQAYKAVKANRGAAGVDGQSMTEFEQALSKNLYRIWNRMASGSYFPPPVRRVEIPKGDSGATRPLGIPTVADRIAQAVVKRYLEPILEPVFDCDSYGYRPGRSALDALSVARRRCWERDWVLDLDVKSFFDEVDWKLLMKAVRHHTDCRWVLLYLQRWLAAPAQLADGTLVPRTRGTPQGSVVSPVLANLFLHYAFDRWMRREYPTVAFERYADDVICHCVSEAQALALQRALATRFAECRLRLHPQKTKVVYCKDANRRRHYPQESFDFLGYSFRPRLACSRRGVHFVAFLPAVSNAAGKRMRIRVRRWRLHRRSDLELADIAARVRPVLMGWVRYYGRFYPSQLRDALRTIDAYLVRWAVRKYKRFRGHTLATWAWLAALRRRRPGLFAHWCLPAAAG